MSSDANPAYTRTGCGPCDSTGRRSDPTNADKVAPGPDRCELCQGNGYRETLIPTAATVAAQQREAAATAAALAESCDPAAEVPAWMLG